MTREVWITGAGLVTPLGETEQAIWDGLSDSAAWRATIDSESHAPFHVHPIRTLDLDRFMKKGDQRAMGPLMHYGTHAAGLALADAGVAGQADLLKRMHLICASTGGERDEALDGQIVAQITDRNDRDVQLNEQLQTGLRPTLFLAQLPNLFAGNISIVHGVQGSSRTFMGEESAGVDAVRIAQARIAAGQADLFLVGSAYNGARWDIMMVYHPAGLLLSGEWRRLWDRPRGGMCLGSQGAFLVLESRDHAEARKAAPVARLAAIQHGRCARRDGEAARNATAQWDTIRARLAGDALAVVSGASGAGPITQNERSFLQHEAQRHKLAVRGTAAALGHGLECMFVTNLALAAWAVRRGALFAPLDAEERLEAQASAGIRQAIVTAWGHHRGEALALVEAV
jgi:3-oxoacyl-[acyl-carrier-protein] synthase II